MLWTPKFNMDVMQAYFIAKEREKIEKLGTIKMAEV